ncbi:sigma-70 family RNA polymerase sigma factor [Candidatus Poribacteria bacterium]|nr:sigma-70 family RNA polymerase sigma factor [Candidatus Poribacteria bacterium]
MGNIEEDNELVKRFIKGDSTAFDELDKKYRKKITQLLYRMMKNYEDAEDIYQEAIFKATQHIDMFDSSRNFYNWLYAIATNHCINQLRKRRRRLDKKYCEEILKATWGEKEPLKILENQELREYINREIETLPERQRRVVQLRLLDGLSYEEIAEILGVNVNSVRSLLRHARNSLKMRLSSYAGALFFIPRQIRRWTGFTAPATVQATGTFTASMLSSIILHFALIVFIVIPTTINTSSDYTDSITVSLLQPGEYQTKNADFGVRIAELRKSFSIPNSELQIPNSDGEASKKHIGGQNTRRSIFSKQPGGLKKESFSKAEYEIPPSELRIPNSAFRLPTSDFRISARREFILPSSMKVNSVEVGRENSVNESGIVGKTVEREDIKVKRNSMHKREMAYSVVADTLPFVNSHSAAGLDATLQDVIQGVMLGNADICPLGKGEGGGIVVGKGCDIKGYFRFARVKCSIIDEYIVEYWWPKMFPALLKNFNAQTNIKADMNMEGSPMLLTDSRLQKCPIIFLLGYDRFELWAPPQIHSNRTEFRLKDSEKEALRKYLVEEGGVLFIDTLPHRMWSKDVPVSRWSFRMKAELREILPEYSIHKIPNDHELYQCFYRLGGPPLTAITSPRTSQLEGISIDGRLAVIYSERAYVGSMTHEGPYWSPQIATFKLMTNIIIYALTHGGISDYSNYTPMDFQKRTATDIPTEPPSINKDAYR